MESKQIISSIDFWNKVHYGNFVDQYDCKRFKASIIYEIADIEELAIFMSFARKRKWDYHDVIDKKIFPGSIYVILHYIKYNVYKTEFKSMWVSSDQNRLCSYVDSNVIDKNNNRDDDYIGDDYQYGTYGRHFLLYKSASEIPVVKFSDLYKYKQQYRGHSLKKYDI